MLYTNALVFTPDRGFVPGGFAVENGRFTEVFSGPRAGGGGGGSSFHSGGGFSGRSGKF